MTELVFRVVGTPLAFARSAGNGRRRFTPPVQASYMNLVKVAADAAMKKAKLQPFDAPLYVSLEVFYPMPKTLEEKLRKKKINHTYKVSKPDVDNLSKIVLDACNGIVWVDDAIIVSLRIMKSYIVGAGYTDVQVSIM